ncbi:MAG TPA: TRAP transporter small permease [bacterium]
MVIRKFIYQLVEGTDRIAETIESLFIYLGVWVMVCLAFIQVVGRNLFSFTFNWGEDLLRILVLWTGFVGASLATRHSRNINIDVLTRLLSGIAARRMNFIVNLFSGIISILLLIAAWQLIRLERQFPDFISSIRIPIWSAEIIFPVVFGIISLRFLSNALRILLGMPESKPEILPGRKK